MIGLPAARFLGVEDGDEALLDADADRIGEVTALGLDECGRRVQNDTHGHRGRKSGPFYRCRRLLTKAKERLDQKRHEKLTRLLRAGDPHWGVDTCWEAKEGVRELYTHADPHLAIEWLTQLGHDLQDTAYPPEARSLGLTLFRDYRIRSLLYAGKPNWDLLAKVTPR